MDLISLFVFRPNRIDRPDGRPFYAYSTAEDTVQRLEDELGRSKCTDATRIKVLAFVAAERFRRNYKDHVWTWADCGGAVSRLREERGHIAFNKLIQDSLEFWGLPPLKTHGRRRYLGSVVTYGGFPVAFLSGQSPLRGLLRHLLRTRMAAGEQELHQAARMAIPASGLPDAFKLSPFFTDLCVRLVEVVADLVLRAGGKSIKLESLEEDQPGWKRKLPLSFDGDDAEQLVAELLNVAAESAHRGRTGLTFKRSIVRLGDAWVPRVEISDLPSRLALPEGCTDPMYRLELCVEGEVVSEIARLARQRDDLYVAFPRLRRSVVLDPSFSAASAALAIQVSNERASVPLEVDGGEALDDHLPWIFEPANGGSDAEREGKASCYDLIAVGSARSRAPSLVVAIQQDWRVSEGTWVSNGEIQSGENGAVRRLIQIEESVTIYAGDSDDFTVHCSAAHDSPKLRLTGTQATVSSTAARQIIVGEARAAAVPPTDGLTIQWRSVGDGFQPAWTTRLKMARGLVRYRLCDGEVTVAETRALILPDQFSVQPRHAAVTVTLDAEWKVDAPPAVKNEETWRISLPASHKSTEIEILLSSSLCANPVVVRIPSFITREGFRRLLDDVAAPARLTTSALAEYVAYGNGPHASLWLTLNGRASFPYRLRSREGMAGSRLPLALIQGDILDLQYSSDEIDVPVTLSIGQKSLEVTPQRLYRAGDTVHLREDRDLLCKLRLRHLSSEHECTLEFASETGRTWSLPEEFPAGWAIVSAAELGIRPLAVHFGDHEVRMQVEGASFPYLIQLEGTSRERVARLTQHLRTTLDHAGSETSVSELEYLRLWLMRFDDLPAEYLDTFKAIAKSPAEAIRLMAYSHGGAAFSALGSKLARIPLYWHLASKPAWDGFIAWWNALNGEVEADLTQSVIQDLALVQLEAMVLDNHTAEIYQGFLIQRARGCVERTKAHNLLFTQLLADAKMAWRNRVAALVDDFHGATFPTLDAVTEAAERLNKERPLNIEFHAAYEYVVPVLVAPLVAAWVSHAAMNISDDLRRQLSYARHLGSQEFDCAYAYAAMLLEQV